MSVSPEVQRGVIRLNNWWLLKRVRIFTYDNLRVSNSCYIIVAFLIAVLVYRFCCG